MSTYSNGQGNVTIDFRFEFDLETTPTLNIIDTSTYSAAQTDIKIFIKVTRPDGIIRDFPETPDISGASGSLGLFGYTMPLDSLSGQPAQGNYKVEYKFYIGSDASTAVTVTKQHNFEYAVINLTTKNNIDEFTPSVFIQDTTPSYDITNYNLTSLERIFSASIPTLSGSVTISSQTNTGTTTNDRKYFIKDTSDKYYDAKYSVVLNIKTTHTHTTFSWVTVKESLQKTILVDVFKPPTKAELIDEIDQLKNLVESYDGVNRDLFMNTKADYEEVITGFDHLQLRLDAGDSDNENNEILQKLINILRNNVARTHTDTELSATSLTIYTQLTNVNFSELQGVPQFSPFETKIVSITSAATEWSVEHNLNKKPSVTVVDDNDNVIMAEVIYESLNKIKVKFNAETQGKVYLN